MASFFMGNPDATLPVYDGGGGAGHPGDRAKCFFLTSPLTEPALSGVDKRRASLPALRSIPEASEPLEEGSFWRAHSAARAAARNVPCRGLSEPSGENDRSARRSFRTRAAACGSHRARQAARCSSPPPTGHRQSVAPAQRSRWLMRRGYRRFRRPRSPAHAATCRRARTASAKTPAADRDTKDRKSTRLNSSHLGISYA